MKKKKGYFSISAVAQMFSVHQQTIRLYEKEGLVNPKRSEGNTRLFSEDDVNKLEEIIYLTHQLGINIAGVEMIFKLKKKIHKMQKELNGIFNQMDEQLDHEVTQAKESARTTAQRLLTIKQKATQKRIEIPQQTSTDPATDEQSLEEKKDSIEAWHVEYEQE